MIKRSESLEAVRGLLSRNRVVAVLGARQVGKTTLARQIAREWKGPVTFFDLEDPEGLRLLEEPMLALRGLRGLVILDEIQRRPELFPVLRVLADEPRAPRYLILGSASPDLLRQTSESLAGRIHYYELGGLSLTDVGMSKMKRLWLRGGFPRSYVAKTNRASAEWRRGFTRTFLERDLPQLGIRTPGRTIGRFWAMLAHYHGQVWNAAEFARSFGVSNPAVARYLDLLASTFVVRPLPPWHENLKKRQVRSPKIYFADSGLLHTQLNITDAAELERHPKVGASWEGFLLHAVQDRLGVRPDEAFFWATHSGAELDLLVVRGRTRRGFEFKRTETPRVTKSMRIAMSDLRLPRLDVVHAGRHTFEMEKGIRAVSWRDLVAEMRPLC